MFAPFIDIRTIHPALSTGFMEGLHDPTDEPVAKETIKYDWETRVRVSFIRVAVCCCSVL